MLYRKLCPTCNNPLDIPIWKRCNPCQKKWDKERYKILYRRRKLLDKNKKK